MSNIQPITQKAPAIEAALIGGDLSKLSAAERVVFYNQVCESLGLNPLTKPFEYIMLNGKLTLYAKRDATDQLRRINKISIEIVAREKHGDLYVVTARARDNIAGRTDESTGAVTTSNLKGEALANAYMKAETKAKRRVTLSICGLGFLDETEIESIKTQHAQLGEAKAKQIQAVISETEPPPEVSYEEIAPPPFDQDQAPAEPGDYVIKISKKFKGKKLSEVPQDELESFVHWAENVPDKGGAISEFIYHANTYLETL
jgi:hypothetical protein